MDNHLFNISLGGMSEEEAQKAKDNIPSELWDRDLYQQQMFSHPTPKTQPPKIEHREYKKVPPNPQAVENAKEYKRALRGEREWSVVKREEEESVVVLGGMEVMRKQLIQAIDNLKQGNGLAVFAAKYGKYIEKKTFNGYEPEIDFNKLLRSIWDKMVLLEAKKQVWDIYQSLIFPKRPTLTQALKKALFNLTHYFINSHEGQLDLNKGILIWGGVGTSKTTLLKTFEEFTKVNNLPTKFQFSKMERLVSIATTEPKALQNHLKALTQQNRVFDDWGVEVNDRWGDGVVYFKNIMLSRYKKRANIKTHLTTNYKLSKDNIPNLENIYSPRIISRLKEMCNLVGLGEGDLRG